MASAYKILGQASPSGTAVTTLYTVPSSTETIVSTITATNVTSSVTPFDLYVVPSAGTAGVDNALVYDADLFGNTVQAFTIGLTLSAGDTLQVKTYTANAFTFQAFGQEIS